MKWQSPTVRMEQLNVFSLCRNADKVKYWVPDICRCDAGAQVVLDAGGWMEDWAVVEWTTSTARGMRTARGPTVVEWTSTTAPTVVERHIEGVVEGVVPGATSGPTVVEWATAATTPTWASATSPTVVTVVRWATSTVCMATNCITYRAPFNACSHKRWRIEHIPEPQMISDHHDQTTSSNMEQSHAPTSYDRSCYNLSGLSSLAPLFSQPPWYHQVTIDALTTPSLLCIRPAMVPVGLARLLSWKRRQPNKAATSQSFTSEKSRAFSWTFLDLSIFTQQIPDHHQLSSLSAYLLEFVGWK